MIVRAGAIAAAVAIAAVVAASQLGASAQSADRELAWGSEPLVVIRGASADRIVSGWIVNSSRNPVSLNSQDVTLRGATGRRVPGVVTFIPGYAHGVLPMDRGPYPSAEVKRLGRIVAIPAGGRSRLTVSWRRDSDRGDPVWIDYGAGQLPIPKRL